MSMTHFRFVVPLVVAGAFTIASTGAFASQGRPASPPGQTNRPASPPGKSGAPPQTPPGQGKTQPPGQAKTQTPPGKAKVAAPIVVKPALASNLQPLLPGLDVTVSAQGFRNLGAFVSAVHVSHNLEIPFAALKTRIVDDGMSLGGAIQAIKPAVNATTEVQKAERQARDDIAKSNAR